MPACFMRTTPPGRDVSKSSRLTWLSTAKYLPLICKYMLSSIPRRMFVFIFCDSIDKSATLKPKNLCGIGTGVIDTNGAASHTSFSSI